MNVVAALRISTAGQEEGYGLDAQRQTVTEWAQANGHELVAVFEDVTSGANGLSDRDGFAQAVATISDGDAEILVVPNLSRLARDLVVQEVLLAEVQRAGGQVASCIDAENAYLGGDPDDHTRILIRQILGAVAAYERGLIAARMKAGRQAKARSGGYSGGSPPLGYRADGRGGVRFEPSEQDTIRTIIGLRMEGTSYQAIADTLNRWGKPTRSGYGHKWDERYVARVIRSEQDGSWRRLAEQSAEAAGEPYEPWVMPDLPNRVKPKTA